MSDEDKTAVSQTAPEPPPAPPPSLEMASQNPPTGILIDFGNDGPSPPSLPSPEASRGNRQSSVIATKKPPTPPTDTTTDATPTVVSSSSSTTTFITLSTSIVIQKSDPLDPQFSTTSKITPSPDATELEGEGLTRAFTEKMAILDAEVAKLTEEEVPENDEKNKTSTAITSTAASQTPLTPPPPFNVEEEDEEESLEEVTISSSDDGKLSVAQAIAEELGHTKIAAGAGSPVATKTSPSSSSGGGGAGGGALLDLNQEYHLKWIRWKGALKLPIVTQNANGPCPLLAIINVLLLRKNIEFPPMIEIITAAQLMEYLCDFLLNNVPTNLPESVKLDFEQNLQDAVTILPRLSTGLDVNVKFSGVSEFEYTRECIIFDLLRIPLYHGWLVDPEEAEVMRVVGSLSYNQLVDRIITYKGGNPSNQGAAGDGEQDPMISSEMFLAEEFLHASASQLTRYGLSQLIARVKEDELCVLFRNNHFITLYKYKGKLYQLATDQGFLTESNVVWESLNNIEGDTYFVDGDFHLVPPKPALPLSASGGVGAPFIANTQQQIDQDYLIALSLEAEQKQEMDRNAAASSAAAATSPKSYSRAVLGRGASVQSPVTLTTSTSTSIRPQEPTKPINSPITVATKNLPPPVSEDEALARRLQEQEEADYQRRMRQQQQEQEQKQHSRQQQHQQGRQNVLQPQPQQQQHRRVMYGSNTTASRGASTAMVNHHMETGGGSSSHRSSHHQVAPQPPPLPRHSSGGGSFGSHQSSSRSSSHHQQHRRSAGDGSSSGAASHERPSGRSLSEDDGDSRGKNKCTLQ